MYGVYMRRQPGLRRSIVTRAEGEVVSEGGSVVAAIRRVGDSIYASGHVTSRHVREVVQDCLASLPATWLG